MADTKIGQTAPATGATTSAMLVQITTDGIPKLHCPVCNKALVSLNGYVKHVKKHEPPGGFICRYCEARYCSEDELKRHMDAVHITIACRICKNNTTFTNESDYREHISVVHGGLDRELYTCDKCGAEYKTIEPFKRHVDTQCGTVKPFKCDQCDMSFVTKYNLKQHKETHSGERKFCCSYCGKNFLQKGRLVEHERSHTGEKPYKCDVCGKCFAHRESIVTHSSIHTGLRLVECRCCHSRFSCYSNLIKHRRTRPDTCGLPEHDPPKNRVRTHRSRIPATLNPSSEIKVSNLNKVIKPDDLEKQKKTTIKTTPDKISNKKTAAATTGKKRGRKSKTATAVESTDSENSIVAENDLVKNALNSDSDDEPLANKRQTRKCNINKIPLKQENEASTHWTDTDDDDDDDFPDFDPVDDSGSDKDFKLPTPVKQELDNDAEHFEYTESSVYIEPACVLKQEEVGNIFNEKDKILDVLLKEDCSQDEIDDNETPEEFISINGNDEQNINNVKLEDGEDILNETEVVLIKEQQDNAETLANEEDALAMKPLSDKDFGECKILLEDITVRYPKLKEDTSVKVKRNVRTKLLSIPKIQQQKKTKKEQSNSDDCDEEKPPKRRYRKRGEPRTPPTNAPKRMAKLSQQQLKERLKMFKKEEKSWKCPFCIKIYHMRKPYEKHLRHDHTLDEDKIQELFKNESTPINELDGEVFKCKICAKIYLMEKRLIAHMNLHGPDGNLTHKCPCYCSLYFASKEEATAHAHKEHRDLLYCAECDKYMTGHDSLKNHIKNHHDDNKKEPRGSMPRNLVCDKCGKKFAGRTSLTDHVRSDCGRVPLYPCTICGKHLTTAGILKTHMLLHKDDTPYQCDKCGKTFKVKAQYKSHLKTRHTDYKPFKCHLCPKEYPYRESLLTHMTVHTGIKRFLCNGCGKRFTCISNLQAHRKVHSDTCGQLPLNAKATQYMGVQKGNLLLGAKPEAGLEYQETNTLLARDVIDRDMPMAQELNFPSEPSAPLATVPLNYAGSMPAQQFVLPAGSSITHMIIDDTIASKTTKLEDY